MLPGKKLFFRTSISTCAMLVCAAAITTQPGAAYAGCGNDNECKGDRICVNNECVDPPPNSAPAPSSAIIPVPAPQPAVDTIRMESSGSEASAAPVEVIDAGSSPEVQHVEESSHVNKTIPPLGLWDIWFNPMGFIQFGPTAGFEIRTAENLYVGVHGRYAAMGMLYNSLLESRANEEPPYNVGTIEVSPKSAAVGAEFKYYIPFPGHANMLYFGMFGEYMWGGYTAYEDQYFYSDTVSDRDQIALYDAAHKSIGLGAMLGHRWRFGETHKVLVTAGLLTGVARPFVSTKKFAAPKETIDMPQRNEFIFMAEIAIGYGM